MQWRYTRIGTAKWGCTLGECSIRPIKYRVLVLAACSTLDSDHADICMLVSAFFRIVLIRIPGMGISMLWKFCGYFMQVCTKRAEEQAARRGLQSRGETQHAKAYFCVAAAVCSQVHPGCQPPAFKHSCMREPTMICKPDCE